MGYMVRIEITNPNLPKAARAGAPVEVVDQTTGQSFVLLPSDQYEKLCRSAAGDFDPRLAYPLVDLIMHEDDANDPWLESYQQ
jgi:hypothetical protein